MAALFNKTTDLFNFAMLFDTTMMNIPDLLAYLALGNGHIHSWRHCSYSRSPNQTQQHPGRYPLRARPCQLSLLVLLFLGWLLWIFRRSLRRILPGWPWILRDLSLNLFVLHTLLTSQSVTMFGVFDVTTSAPKIVADGSMTARSATLSL